MNRRRRLTALTYSALAATLTVGLAAQPALGEAKPPAAAQGAATADLPWMDPDLSPEIRATLLISAMTLDQKIQQLANKPGPNAISGTYLSQTGQTPCLASSLGRHLDGIPELGIPTIREVNGGNGVRGGDCELEPIKTAGPSMTLAAASFDPEATQRWGEVVGSETKSFAHQILLGPGMNLVRSPYAGRAQEYPGEDPYLAGVIASAQVKGIQSQGTQAMIKHFAGNELEYDFERCTAASRIPSRAMHELYLLPFEMTVKDAKPASIMCAYPHLNHQWACESSPLLKQTLRTNWGFDGWIESDRRAMHSTAASIKAGVGYELDEEPVYYSPENIHAALEAGQITVADINAVLKPRYVQMFRFGQFEDPYTAFGVDDLDTNATKQRELAESGVTLLKNSQKLLPLGKNVTSIALIGPQWFAGQAAIAPRNTQRDGLTGVVPKYTVTPQQGIEAELKRLGSSAKVTYNRGNNIPSAVALAKRSDLVIMMLGTNPRETRDMLGTDLPTVTGVEQDALAAAVTKANAKNVVVLKTAAGVTMSWQRQARAIVAAWFPGMDDGDVVAGVLFGRINPSGKTPVSWPQTAREAGFDTERQYPGVREWTGIPGGPGRVGDPNQPQLVNYYDEGLAMGYRWYEENGKKPVYPFGFGLSYTSFGYSNLKLTSKVVNVRAKGKTPASKKTVLTVTFNVKNTGKVIGAEAAQVYLTLPNVANEPSKRLVGFDKVELRPGQTRQVQIVLDSASSSHPFSYFAPSSRSLANWANGQWVSAKGRYTVSVGGSSASTPLVKKVSLKFPK